MILGQNGFLTFALSFLPFRFGSVIVVHVGAKLLVVNWRILVGVALTVAAMVTAAVAASHRPRWPPDRWVHRRRPYPTTDCPTPVHSVPYPIPSRPTLSLITLKVQSFKTRTCPTVSNLSFNLIY